MDIDTEEAIKALASRGIRIPPQPSVLVRLNRALAKDACDMRALARIIADDPGLTAMLFKAAGSPVFGHGKRLDSLEQVLMVVGVKQTYNLVQAMAITTAVGDSTRQAFEVFWTRSREVADLAAMIAADRVTVCNVFPDQAYMAGIFHECGVPVLMQRFPDYCGTLHLANATCCPVIAEEDDRYNVDHCSIGYLVARHWNLPDFVCQAIRYHHEVPSEEIGLTISLVAIVQLAIHFYYRIVHRDNPCWPKMRDFVLGEVGIHTDGEQEYFEDLSERFLAR